MSQRRFRAYISENEIEKLYMGTKEKSLQESAYHGDSMNKPFNNDDLYNKSGDLSLYEDMLKDDQVYIGAQTKKDMVLTSGWDIVTEEEDQDDIRADLECALMEDPDIPFEASLEEMLTAYDFGYSITEKVFKKRKDGTLTMRFLKTRHPDTWLVHTDKHGNVERYQQRSVDDDLFINPKSLIHMVNNRRFQNPYGSSDLRPAYQAWFTKRQIMRYYGIYLEKAASPTPVARYDENAPVQAVTDLHNAIKKFQAKTALTIPKAIEVEFLEAKHNGEAFIKGINIMNMMIGRSLLVPDLIGISGSETSGGSFSLGQEHLKLYFKHIDRRRRDLEQLVNDHIVKPIIVANWGFMENFPKFKFKPLIEEDMTDNLKLWLDSARLKIYEPTDDEINYFRSQINFPEGEIVREEVPDPTAPNNPADISANPDTDSGREVEVEEEDKAGSGKESFSQKKTYIQFTEDFNFFHFTVRRTDEFVPGSLYDKEVQRGIVLRLGSLISDPKVNETIQQVAFNKEIHTLAQAQSWMLENVVPIAPRTVPKPGDDGENPDLSLGQQLREELNERPEMPSAPQAGESIADQLRAEMQEFSNKKTMARPFKPDDMHKRVDFAMLDRNLTTNLDNLMAVAQPTMDKIFNKFIESIEKKKIVQNGKFEKIDTLKLTNLGEMKTLLKSDLRKAFDMAKKQANSELFKSNFGEPLASDEFLKFLDNETFQFIGDWEFNITKGAATALRKAVKDGDSLASVIRLMNEENKKAAQVSLERYARTKFTEVMNKGRLEAFNESGVVTGYQYSAVLDAQTTPICRGLHNKKFAAGTEPIPPMHFNCRSLLIPITRFESFTPTEKIGKQDPDSFIKDNAGKGFGKR